MHPSEGSHLTPSPFSTFQNSYLTLPLCWGLQKWKPGLLRTVGCWGRDPIPGWREAPWAQQVAVTQSQAALGGRDLKAYLVPSFAMGRETFPGPGGCNTLAIGMSRRSRGKWNSHLFCPWLSAPGGLCLWGEWEEIQYSLREKDFTAGYEMWGRQTGLNQTPPKPLILITLRFFTFPTNCFSKLKHKPKNSVMIQLYCDFTTQVFSGKSSIFLNDNQESKVGTCSHTGDMST